MKTTIFVIICLCLSVILQAQVSKTVEVTPGSLHTLLTQDELTTITDLTLTGSIDGRDFRTMRDTMLQLENLDMATVIIEAYEGNQDSYNKNEIPANAFSYGSPKLKSIALPLTATSIGYYAFAACYRLTSINIPASVQMIEQGAFYNCTALRSIYCFGATPALLPGMSYGYIHPFSNVDKTLCILYVPYSSKELYASGFRWSVFKNIVEMPGIMLSKFSAILSLKEGSQTSVNVFSIVEWTASSDQPWLTLSHASGSGDQTITFTAKGNTKTASRVAIVTFSSADVPSQTFTVRQEGVPKVLNITPGELSAALTDEELKSIMNLTLSGTIDARDFKIMRDSMPVLTTVDLSEATIAAYSGPEGTASDWENILDYPANEVPYQSFNNKISLTHITLPASATSIGMESFAYCPELTSVNIPSSVVTIGNYAFSNCYKLASLDLPNQLTTIGNRAFESCSAFKSIIIPSTVTNIGEGAFYGCSGLTSIKVNSTIPVNLNNSRDVFSGVNTADCKLMVPYKSKARYVKAPQWKDFRSIEEPASGIIVEVNHLEFDAGEQSYTLAIASNVAWTVSSNQPWLSFISPSWNGDQALTITLKPNPDVLGRKGLLTITPAVEGTPQIIYISQKGVAKTVTLTAGNLLSSLTDDELKGINHLILSGTIDARDFKTIRDKMPLLNFLDLSQSTVVAYAGNDGTNWKTNNSIIAYLADEIPAFAFRSQVDNVINDKLKTIILPLTVKSIGVNAFMDCPALATMTIPPTVTKIGNNAFFRCLGLELVTLPPSVTTIGSFAFYGCTALQSIYSQGATPAVIAYYARAFSGCNMTCTKLYVPGGSKQLYAKANEWKDFKNIIEMTTATEQLEQNKASFTCYPNPFTSELSIEIANPLHKEVSVDIYSISGQKIKSLVRAQKGANITLLWNGTNEQGQQVPNGLYLVKVNEKTMKVVKR